VEIPEKIKSGCLPSNTHLSTHYTHSHSAVHSAVHYIITQQEDLVHL